MTFDRESVVTITVETVGPERRLTVSESVNIKRTHVRKLPGRNGNPILTRRTYRAMNVESGKKGIR